MQENGIVQSPIGQLTVDHQSFPFKLSWTHYQVLMTIEDPAERSFYELEAIKGVWNVKTLKRQYHSSLYERLALSRDKNEVMAMAIQGAMPYRPEDILKSPFVLEFAGLNDNQFKERGKYEKENYHGGAHRLFFGRHGYLSAWNNHRFVL